MKVTKITIGRLYNTGSYEHVRYELTAEIPEGESAAVALIGMEKILDNLSPKTSGHSRQELDREKKRLEDMGSILATEGVDEFRRRFGHFVGRCDDYLARCRESFLENVARREEWEKRNATARQMLDDLGGAANWKDAKLDWQFSDDDDQ